MSPDRCRVDVWPTPTALSSMANFAIAYELVKDAEGGYQKSPDDPGNYNSLDQLVGTNYGVSAAKYEGIIGRPPSENDMRNLTAAAAREIFRRDEWTRIQGDRITSQAVANIFFDGAVNHGKGIHLMQEVLRVPQDGVVGPVTLNAINTANPQSLYLAYKERRRQYYHQLVAWDERLYTFLDGWLNRLETFDTYTAAAAGGTGILILAAIVWWAYRK